MRKEQREELFIYVKLDKYFYVTLDKYIYVTLDKYSYTIKYTANRDSRILQV